jgi:4-hydroxythreonine-4-phosphate dehydrogenase
MGDPAGIGPEICLRLLAESSLREVCVLVVIGDARVLARVAKQLHLPLSAPVFNGQQWPAVMESLTAPAVLDMDVINASEVMPGIVNAACGAAAYHYIVKAIELAQRGDFAAIATGPINKEALHAAGFNYPGHTEIFAERFAAERWCMMLTSEEITCSLVTVHVGYGEVPALLSTARIVEVIELTAAAMQRLRSLGSRLPRLVVCGLNPHAGEHGLFGQGEEERIIEPAVKLARERGYDVVGPLPPDTAFMPARRAATDAYICMYHDQGLIPLKALAFDSAINTTLGLSIVRTSVDHGTAFDIAWQGKASAQSLIKAVETAVRLARPAPSASV